ncbi:MAG: SusD/RagB family nutrient-binding outer membrane lipoprotein [Chitinophagaceae bacterium]|nr:SusD/RagB family nutrient-binding outer membrane lipoprotein [Chitinophagaceae bacterium]
MRYLKYLIIFSVVTGMMSCKKYLDINSDPDTPQTPDPSSIMPAMLSAIPRGIQFDARYIGKFIQNWSGNTSGDVWDIHSHQGFPGILDNGGDIWRQTYFGLGLNLNYIINEGIKKGQWDYVGAAYALKAYMFQNCTDVYGDMIYSEAFKENTSTFKYDEQQIVYRGVDSLCRLALSNLIRDDLNPASSILAKGDFVYDGDRAKWIRFVNGILARNFMRYSNKPNFNTTFADSVIYYVDRSFASGTDDFLIPFDASKNDDANFFGPFRNNMATFRQTHMIVRLLDGTTLAGSNVPFANRDPRIKHMLSASQDTMTGVVNGGYRSVEPGQGDPQNANTTSRTRVANLWGDSLYANPSASVFSPGRGKYLFKDKTVSPVMSYSELQFLKAEAALKKSPASAVAYTAYLNGIGAHFDFINRGIYPRGNVQLYNLNPISAAEKTGYLAGNNVKKTAAALTLTDIMLQKYIAMWGWGFVETWVDLRRYNYTGTDPVTTQPVYKGFIVPTNLIASNNGQLTTRIRPRYNSEYVWNREELDRIGATSPTYHVKPMWFSLP